MKIGDYFTCYSGWCRCIDTSNISKISVGENARPKIGHHSGMSNTVIDCGESITIGDYVKIGAGCVIMDSNFHSTDWRIRMTKEDCRQAKTAPVVIGDVAFIGARSIICKGVTIGDHSIIAAGSVVVKDIPSNCVACGNPCRVIKQLD